jgi:cobalt-zinc-cadmium efflux system protein
VSFPVGFSDDQQENEGDVLEVTDEKLGPGAQDHTSKDSGHLHDHHLAGEGAADVGHTSAGRLLAALVLNLIIPAVQVVFGVRAHSMALISDAAHNFSDFTALLIAYIANRIARRGASVRNTFGYRRAEILAALINAALLTGIAGFIIYEAIGRLYRLESVTAPLVIMAAGIGVLGNGLSAWLLHRDSKHNLNMRGAFLHMLGDLLTSVVVLLNGIILTFKPWYWLDPMLSVLIACFITWNCWTILKTAVSILMNATPSGIEIAKVKDFLEGVPGVNGVHYLHAWNLCSSSVALSCHVVVPDQSLSKVEPLSKKIRHLLRHHFGIDHPVLQFETIPCGEGDLLCGLNCARPEEPASHPDGEKAQSRRNLLFRMPFLFWVRLLVGVIFIAASIDKILHPAAFAQMVYNYQILPDAFINLTAIVLPWVELVLGSLLVVGLWIPGSVVLANLLFLAFFGSLLFNLARGLNIHCGCFSSSTQGNPLTTWYLIRDAVFLLLGGYLFYGVFLKRGREEGRKQDHLSISNDKSTGGEG